jgi:hypothetical protein
MSAPFIIDGVAPAAGVRPDREIVRLYGGKAHLHVPGQFSLWCGRRCGDMTALSASQVLACHEFEFCTRCMSAAVWAKVRELASVSLQQEEQA